MKLIALLLPAVLSFQENKQFELTDNFGMAVADEVQFKIKNRKRIRLSKEQLRIADSLVNQYISKDDASEEREKNENYYSYYRQYVGYVSEDGRNTVFINAFLRRGKSMTDKFLKTNLVSVDGGGYGYFKIKVNLEELSCYNLKINAPF